MGQGIKRFLKEAGDYIADVVDTPEFIFIYPLVAFIMLVVLLPKNPASWTSLLFWIVVMVRNYNR